MSSASQTTPSTAIAPAADLLRRARDEGELSPESFDALTLNADIGAQIQAALGVVPDDVPAAEVVLVTVMPDDSGSIASAGNEQHVRDGHNGVLDALLGSAQRDGVLAHTRYLNGTVLFPYRRLADAERMTPQNYAANLGTPLYDQTVVLLGTVVAKAKEFEDAGVPVRTVTLIVTDGADCHSVRHDAKAVRSIVRDMLRRETHIVAGLGISDGATDFRAVFRGMGIPDEWILTPAHSAADIRAAFHVFSRSAVRASQSAHAFSQAAFGGFGG